MRDDEIELIDAGGGRRLERFGARIVDRPHPGAEGPRRDPDAWSTPDLRFHPATGWVASAPDLLEPWAVEVEGLTLELRPTESGQLGVFPEHRMALPWLEAEVRQRAAANGSPPRVLHLFAHTGLATLALARAGAAVAHVDGSRPAVAWARRNAELSGLADRPVRWLVDDALTFVQREIRRGSRYDGLVLDPPSYGHAGGRAWSLAADLPVLLDACSRIVARDAFVLLTAHAEAFDAERLGDLLATSFRGRGRPQVADLTLAARSGGQLRLGAAARIG